MYVPNLQDIGEVDDKTVPIIGRLPLVPEGRPAQGKFHPPGMVNSLCRKPDRSEPRSTHPPADSNFGEPTVRRGVLLLHLGAKILDQIFVLVGNVAGLPDVVG